MKFTVTMECGKCNQKFSGQNEHLVDAVTAMVKSAVDAEHNSERLNGELDALATKAHGVNVVDHVLGILGLEPDQVDVQIMDPITLEQARAMMRGEDPPEEDAQA